MTRINPFIILPDYDMETHLLHEVIHGIHYSFSPEFYPGNYNTIKEIFLNKMIAEGIATFISGEITGVCERKALSFGFMDKPSFEKWVKTCKNLKKDFWTSLEKCFLENKYDGELWNKLFSVPDLEEGCLLRGRFGYYYGLEIVRELKGTRGNKGLLNIKTQSIQV